MDVVVKLVRPLVIKAMNSCEVKTLVCDLLDRYVKTTDNDVDNYLADMVRKALLKEC